MSAQKTLEEVNLNNIMLQDYGLEEIRNTVREVIRLRQQALDFYREESLASCNLVGIENRALKNVILTYEDAAAQLNFMSYVLLIQKNY
jgi:hypothetical protein